MDHLGLARSYFRSYQSLLRVILLDTLVVS